MCGLAGFLVPGTPIDETGARRTALAMVAPITHRGPDDQGAWVSPVQGFAVGFKRLAIIDLSPAGHQPMMSSDGRLAIAYNGEIYNADELRRAVEERGVVPRGHSDTEVMLEHMALFGIAETVARLIGMFAIAVFCRETGELTLIRDRLGIKPLYWAERSGTVLFGSQPKCLLAHPVFEQSGGPSLDHEATALYLRLGYIPAPRSILEGVRKLEPGHMVEIDAHGRARDRCYWDLGEAAERGRERPLGLDDEEAIAAFDDLFTDAVRRRMVADVPLGAFLSGGIDSSLVVSRMQRLSPRPVKTFTIGFTDPRFDEAAHARAVAEALGTDHHELRLEPREALDLVPDLPVWFDEPFADSSQLPTLLVSQLARRHVTVSLSGDGGDELFAGYTRYDDVDRLRARSRHLPDPLRKAFAAAIRGASRGRSRACEKLQRLAVLLDGSPRLLMRDIVSHWREPSWLMPGVEEPLPHAWLDDRALGTPEDLQLTDMLTYLPEDILAKVDRASMAVSLEARVPLLDHRLVELVWSLAPDQRRRDGTSKWMLRELLARDLPRELFERPKKGFSIPIHEWLRGPLRDWAETLLAPASLARLPMLDAAFARDVWKQHLDGRADRRFELWNLLMLVAWHEKWMGKNATSAPTAHPALV